MDINKFKKLIEKRENTHSEDPNGLERIWNELTDFLSENINDTINYLKTDCTGEEFSWISEIFDDIVEKTQSKEFIDCLYEVAKKYPKETEKYNITRLIEYAKDWLDDDYETSNSKEKNNGCS